MAAFLQSEGLSWFLTGCAVVGFPYAVLDTPQMPVMRLLGESPAYIELAHNYGNFRNYLYI